MEITLEKIELVRDRTGVTYREAKEALEATDGNVVEAIIAIEETVDGGVSRSTLTKKDELVSRMKETARKGKVTRIVVSREGETLLNIPLTAGILGTVIAPWGMIAGVAAAFGFKCNIEFIKEDGTALDLTGKATEFVGNAREKGQDVYFDLKEKGTAIYSDLKEKAPVSFDDLKVKGEEVLNAAKDAANQAKSRIKGATGDLQEFDFEEFKENVARELREDAAEAKDAFFDVREAAKVKVDDIIAAAKEKVAAAKTESEESSENVEEIVEEAVEEAEEAVEEVVEIVEDFAEEVAETVEEAAEETAEKVEEDKEDLAGFFRDVMASRKEKKDE